MRTLDEVRALPACAVHRPTTFMPASKPVRILLRAARWLVPLIVIAYAGLLFWFRMNESALLFHPVREKVAPPPARLNLDSRDVVISGPDAAPLTARLIPPPPQATGGPWILYLHGASGNVGTLGYNEAWAKFRRLGLGVLAVDYRGYGESAGVPSETGLYRDADAAYAYLSGTLHVPPARILIYGYSLGSAVAIDLASRVPAAALLVEGAFTSIPDRGSELYPYVPVHWLARNRFASAEKIARVSMPKLFIHARMDTYVPIAHGQKLFELARPPKAFQAVAGGHTNAHEVDPGFFTAISTFVVGLGLPILDAKTP